MEFKIDEHGRIFDRKEYAAGDDIPSSMIETSDIIEALLDKISELEQRIISLEGRE